MIEAPSLSLGLQAAKAVDLHIPDEKSKPTSLASVWDAPMFPGVNLDPREGHRIRQ